MTEIHTFLNQVMLDAAKAVPAAVVAVVFVLPAKPYLRDVSFFGKLCSFLASVMAGVMCGQVAREFAQSRDYAPLAVIAGTFLAQDLAMAAAVRGRRVIKNFNPNKKPHETQ